MPRSPQGPAGTRNTVAALASALAIVAVYATSLWFSDHRFIHRPPSGVAFAYKQAVGPLTEALLAFMALAESALLYAIFRFVGATVNVRTVTTVVGIAAVVMLAISMEPASISPDAYYYVLYAKAPTLAAAYRAASLHFPVGFQALGTILKERPLLPSVYGPLWQLLDRTIVGPSTSLGNAVVAIRVTNAVALMTLFLAVWSLEIPVEFKAIVVLNPALYFMYVVEAHNDVVPLAVLGIGLAMVRRSWVAAAIVCGIVAGAMKISFVIMAMAALATRGSRRARWSGALAIVLGAIVLSYAVAGAPYVHAILRVGEKQGATATSHAARILRIAVQWLSAASALIAVYAAIFYRRVVAWAAFTFAGISGLVHAWYFPWGLPYALCARAALVPFAVALPAVTFLSSADEQGFHFTSVMLLVATASVAWNLASRRGLISIDH